MTEQAHTNKTTTYCLKHPLPQPRQHSEEWWRDGTCCFCGERPKTPALLRLEPAGPLSQHRELFEIYGRPHPDGANFAPLFITSDQHMARRIVACWNALAGFSTEEIEKGKAAGIIRHREDAGEPNG